MWTSHELYDLWLMDLDRGSPRRLTDDHAGNHGSFASDGRSVVFSSTRSGHAHLWEMPIVGSGEPAQRTFGQGWEEMEPDVSLDGRLVLYDVEIASVQLFAQPVAGGPRRRITSGLQDLSWPQPTPDGRLIIATALMPSLREQIIRLSLDGGDLVPLVEGHTPALTPDGTEVVYSLAGTGQVLAVPSTGAHRVRSPRFRGPSSTSKSAPMDGST